MRSRTALRPGHEQVVEGGTAWCLRRLQPEREGPHGRLGIFGAADARRPGIHAAELGGGARLPPGAVHRADRVGAICRPRRSVAGHRDLVRFARRHPRPCPAARAGPETAQRHRAAPVHHAVGRDRPSEDQRRGLAGLERWKARHPTVVSHLEPADILVDGMRGRSSLWYRIRVNLQHVPEAERPVQEPLEVDYDPWVNAPWPRAGD